MKKGVVIFFLIIGCFFTVVYAPNDLAVNAYAEGLDIFGSDEVAMSVGDVTASQGETVEVPINLTENKNGISSFRIILTCKDLSPDASCGVGGYIKENADDILYNFSENQALIVWGKGDGNQELKKKTLDISENYTYTEKTDKFFTVHFTVPENAKVGTKYTVEISNGSKVYNSTDDLTIPISAKGTIEVVKSDKTEKEDDNSSKENKSDKDKNKSEDTSSTASKEEKDTKDDSVPMGYLVFLGVFSVIAVSVCPLQMVILSKKK